MRRESSVVGAPKPAILAKEVSARRNSVVRIKQEEQQRGKKLQIGTLEAIRKAIDDIRNSLDETERQYKMLVTNRRTQAPRVFTAADTEQLSIQETDLVSKAKQELGRVRYI